MLWIDDPPQRALARRCADHILIGGRISGVTFAESRGLGDTGPFLVVLIDWDDDRRFRGPARLSLEGRWLISTEPLVVPHAEDVIPDTPVAAQMESLWMLRDDSIAAVEILDVAPHLVLTLASGRVIFAWGGMCNHLEPWQLEYDRASFLLVCCGWQVATWAPDDFARDG